MRAQFTGYTEHFIRYCHFKIQPRSDGVAQNKHIAVQNMPAVFTQVHGNAISARLLGHQCRMNRLRIISASGLTQCRNMVNIHAQINSFRHKCTALLRFNVVQITPCWPKV